MKKKQTSSVKQVSILAAVVVGLLLIIGATMNLPVSAQGLVTGRNTILVEQLVDRVGAQALVKAAADAGLVPANSALQDQAGEEGRRVRANRRGEDRDGNNDGGRRNGR